MIELLAYAYTLTILSYAGLLDIRYREIPPVYWLITISIGLPITLLTNQGILSTAPIYTIISLVVVAITYAMYKMCMIGGADVLAFLTISLLTPSLPNGIIPTLYMTILYTIIPAIAYHIYASTLACNGFKITCITRLKHKVKARLIIEDPRFKWWLVEGSGDCSIEGDPKKLALKAGSGDLESIIIASPGHPFVAYTAIGYAITLILGDKPLIKLVLEIIQHL